MTISDLKKMISEEKANIGAGDPVETVVGQTCEVEADEYADTLEKKIDYMRALKVEAIRLRKRLSLIDRKLAECRKMRVVGAK
mgnify:CR=1 FL=1